MQENILIGRDSRSVRRKIEDAIGKEADIFVYDVCDSTSTQAKYYAENTNPRRPAIFIAMEQTAGRGTHGRSFTSAKCRGLYMSILFFPTVAPERSGDITTYAASAALRAIDSLSNDKSLAGIKWVNDLYARGKKLAGILTEGALGSEAKLRYAVVGIGINITAQPELSDIATSLSEIGIKTDIAELGGLVAGEFFKGLELLGSDEARREYISRSVLIGKKCSVDFRGERFTATVTEIDGDLALIAEADDGRKMKFTSGEAIIKPIL